MNDQYLENQTYEKLDRRIIRSPLLIATAVLFAVGAILTIISAARLLDPAHRTEILYGLVVLNIVDASALKTWFCIVAIGKILFALYSVTFAVGLGMILISSYRRGEQGSLKGFSVIGILSRASVWLWCGLCAVAVVVFVVKFVSYIITVVNEVQEFLFPLIAMVTSEIPLFMVAMALAALIIKFLNETSGLAYQSYYMLRTGRAESHIDPFCYIMFFALAVLCAYLVYFFSYDIIAIVCFSVLSAVSLLLGVCIRLFKREIEWIKYRNYKAEKEHKERG